MTKVRRLRKLMQERTVHVLGAHDAFSAALVERGGFGGVYLGSFASEASFLGRPDMGFMPVTERAVLARHMVRAVDIPVIVDAEEGYGSAIHVMDAVQRLEETGADAIHIDDEKIPSKCPYLPGAPQNSLISVEEMKGKIKAAIEARDDPDFLIIARSDVVGTVPIEEFKGNRRKYYGEAVRRCNEYAKAGADMIFAYGLFSKEDAEFFKKAVKAPLLGLYSPASPVPFESYKKLGYQVVISPVAMLFSAVKGMMKGLEALRESKGDWLEAASKDVFVDLKDFYDIVKLNSYKNVYKKYHIS